VTLLHYMLTSNNFAGGVSHVLILLLSAGRSEDGSAPADGV
jgi:hypothetical protein